MPLVTYNAPQDDSEVVTYMGVKFFSGHPIEVDASEHAALIGKALGNPHFNVEGADEAATKDDPKTPAERGSAAAIAGKPRSVPPAYRGKSEEIEWLTGYDNIAGK
jgi:hypothetical protein